MIFSRIGRIASIILMLSLLFLFALQIVARNENITAEWTEELSRYIFVWLVMLGAAMAVERTEHPAIELFKRPNSPPPRVLFTVRTIVMMMYCLSYLFIGIKVCIHQWSVGNTGFSLPVPLWLVHAALPTCFILMAYNLMRNYFRSRS